MSNNGNFTTSEVVKEEINHEKKRLEKKLKNGHINQQLYKLKTENLDIISNIVNEGDQKWKERMIEVQKINKK